MKLSQGWLLVALVLLAGCKTPHGLAEMERELRFQEDMIYQLQDYIATYKSHLDDCRKENQRLRREAGEEDGERSLLPPEARRQPRGQRPEEDSSDDGLRPPSVDIPGLEGLDGGTEFDLPDPDNSSGETEAEYQVVRGSRPNGNNAEGAPVELTLNEAATGGYDTNGEPGDEGLRILLEPRDAGQNIIKPSGEISIAVLDPAAGSSLDARIARWKFDADQTKRLFEDSPADAGAFFELTWPDGPPRNSDLRLYVRVVTPEGKRLVTSRMIRVEPGGSEDKLADDRERQQDGASVLKQRVPTGQPPPAWSARPAPTPDPKPLTSVPALIAPSVVADQEPNPKAEPRSAPEEKAVQRPQWSPYR